MAESNKGNESFARIKERIDLEYESPEERASKVYKLIENHEMPIWDIICFCMVFITNSCSMFEFMKPVAKQLHTLVYLAHYKAIDELGLKKRE